MTTTHVIPTALAEALVGRPLVVDEPAVAFDPHGLIGQAAPCGAHLDDAHAEVVSVRVLRRAPWRFAADVCWSCVTALLAGERTRE